MRALVHIYLNCIYFLLEGQPRRVSVTNLVNSSLVDSPLLKCLGSRLLRLGEQSQILGGYFLFRTQCVLAL